MRIFLFFVVSCVAVFLFGLFFAGIWWSLWMNSGWIGLPEIIIRLFNFNGDEYYDLVFDLMMAVGCFLGLVFEWFLVKAFMGSKDR